LEDLGDAWTLRDHLVQCEDSPFTIGGYFAASYVINPYNPTDRFNGPMTWTDRANEFQLNEAYLYFGRAVDTESCTWDIGYRVDALWGTNYRWDTSAGYETGLGNGQFYGLAVPASYVEVAKNNLSIKAGRFMSPVGYYVIGQGFNYFAVLPYTYQYGEPFTHTGVLATYSGFEDLTISGGVTHGWDKTDNSGNPHAGALATATYTIDENRALAWVGTYGREPNLSGVNLASNGLGYSTRYFQTLVYTHKFSDDILGVVQSDYGIQGDALAQNQAARWYGVNTYLYWNQTCRLQWGLNGEWFRDEGGFRVGQFLPSFGSPNARGLARGPGWDGSFYRLMFGPKYYFNPNMYTRVAAVFDWYTGSRTAAGLLPFDDGVRSHQQVLAMDFVVTF